MDSLVYWEAAYQEELTHAITAQSSGNEGMARVCARRAAGIVIGEYLERLGYTNLTHSMYDRLAIFDTLSSIDPICKEIAGHFLLKVDHDHNLPDKIDLIADVQLLKKLLLTDTIH